MPATLTRTHLEKSLKAAADPERAAFLARYFKTGKGEYGEGDIFLALTVPALRKIALQHRTLSLADLKTLLNSKFHEHRDAALEILAAQYKRGDEKRRRQIVRFYLSNTRRINNWDLVDGSCRPILGEHLKTNPRAILDKLCRSKTLWERRIAIISTMSLVWAGRTRRRLPPCRSPPHRQTRPDAQSRRLGPPRSRAQRPRAAPGLSRNALRPNPANRTALRHRTLPTRPKKKDVSRKFLIQTGSLLHA